MKTCMAAARRKLISRETLNRITLLCALLGLAVCSEAQDIAGTVTDNQQRPVEFATIVLLDAKDSTYITGAITDIDGRFAIKAEHPGLLKVSCLGYGDTYVDAAPGNIGTIRLTPSSVALGEVVVSATRPRTKIKDDALVTTIENSALAHAGTANDVLGRVPGVIKTARA